MLDVESGDGMLQGESIICLAPGYWDESWLDMHRYMLLLAVENRVLVIERPVTPLSFITPGQKGHAWPQISRWLRHEVRQIGKNLYVAAPPPGLPLRFETPMLLFNQYFRRWWIRRQMRRLNLENPILWIYDPDAAPLVGQLGEKLALYMVTDDYASMPVFINRRTQIRKWESRLIRKVNLVVASEEGLADQKRTENPNTIFVSHGVERDIFTRTLDRATEIAPELRDITGPIIGFIGRINQRIDLAIMEALCARWMLVLVGSWDEDDPVAKRLAQNPQVHIIPAQPVERLPHYLKAMAVGIIPYRIDAYTRHSHPLKALEYLAAGRPVVSTSMSALRTHAPYITFADSPEAFSAAVAHTLETDTPEAQHQRCAYTQDKTWAHQLRRIIRAMPR